MRQFKGPELPLFFLRHCRLTPTAGVGVTPFELIRDERDLSSLRAIRKCSNRYPRFCLNTIPECVGLSNRQKDRQIDLNCYSASWTAMLQHRKSHGSIEQRRVAPPIQCFYPLTLRAL